MGLSPKAEPVITAVAFDMNGVLTPSIYSCVGAYAAELGLPTDAFDRFWRDDPNIARLELGAITSRQFFKYVCIEAELEHGTRIDIHRLGAAAYQAVDPTLLDPVMTDLVRRLRDIGITTALLTNNVREARWRDGFPLGLFDCILDSSELGLRKPDPAIYQILINKLARPASEIAFIDDQEQNLPPAAALGIHTVHFSDAAQCEHELRRLGLDIANSLEECRASTRPSTSTPGPAP